MKIKILIHLFICTLCFGCNSQPDHLTMLANAPVIDKRVCDKEGEFKQSICSFKDVDTVRYSHFNNSPVHDFKSVKEDIDKAIIETFKLANKVAIEVDSNLDVVIKYEYLDGLGGTLAKANYPSCNPNFIQTMTFDNYDVPPGKNTPDSVLIYYKNIKNISVITKHEVGHLLGLMHDASSSGSMMYPYYDQKAEWSQDELSFFDLNFKQDSFIPIGRKDNFEITTNFNIKEFFTKCKGLDFHRLDKKLIVAAEKIREFYGSPVIINSSYRSPTCNHSAGGALKSRHIVGRAIDFSFVKKADHLAFIEDIKNNNYIVKVLKSCGINSVGLYNNHIHLDSRKGVFTVFDKTSQLLLKKTKADCDL